MRRLLISLFLLASSAFAQIGHGPISGGGGGASGPATELQSPVVIEGTTADSFEGNFTFADPTADWTWAWGAAGDLVGAGSLSIDNVKLDGNTISSTDTNGNINLAPNGTGQVVAPIGSASLPGISFSGDPNTGIFSTASDAMYFSANGVNRVGINTGGISILSGDLFLSGTGRVTGALQPVQPRTNGVGSPFTHGVSESNVITTNEGTTEKVYITLPSATYGLRFSYVIDDTDGLRVTANSGDTIRVIDKVTGTAGYIESTTIGSAVVLQAINATEWLAMSVHGSWTDGTFTYDDTSLTTP